MSELRDWPVWSYVAALGRRRGVFVWSTLAMSALLAAFVYGLPNVYGASASLLVQGQLELGSATSPSTIDARLQTIKQEAFSRARLTELVHRFDLYGVSQGRMVLPDAIDRLQKDVQVVPTSTSQAPNGGEQTVAFQVRYVGKDPNTVADVANALASFFIEQNSQLRAQQASRATEYLGAQLADTRRRMEEQEARVRAYSSRNLGGLPQQLEVNLAAINRLDAQLRLNNAEQLRLMERRQSLKNDIAQLDVQVPPDTDTTPEAQVARLERDLAAMRMRFGPDYPDVKAAVARLDSLRRDVAAGEKRAAPAGASARPRRTALEQSLAEVEAQLERISAEDATIGRQIQAYQQRVERTPADQPTFEALARDYQSTRDQVDALQRRYDEARLTERGVNTPEFRMLDAAVPPTVSAGPQRPLLASVGVLFALLVGVAAALILDQTDTSFHTVDDVRQFTRVPVLASIPVMDPHIETVVRVRRAAVASAGLVAIAGCAFAVFVVAQSSDAIARLLSRVL